LEESATGPGYVQCDAGLWESAVPLRNGGQTFGYFLIGGYFNAPLDLPAKNKIRHLFQRVGVEIDPATLDVLCAESPLIDPARHAALARLLTLGATHLVLEITDNLVTPSEQLPPLAQAACDLARQTFTQEVSFRMIARKLGVSTSHLSRVFHHATGMRCREYVGRLRAEHARNLLLTTDRPITEIAFAAGFQSISQFNRIFRAMHGSSPQDIRREKAKG
jgi:AraC-like DNA-binding protein